MMGLIVVNYNFLPKPFYYRLLLAQSKLPKTNFFSFILRQNNFQEKDSDSTRICILPGISKGLRKLQHGN